MNATDLAYTAGIIDGEGSICIAKVADNHTRRGYLYRFFISLTSTDECLVLWLKSKFGGYVSSKIEVLGRKPTWKWGIQCGHAAGMLRDIRPYLVIKDNQVEVALAFQSHKRHNGGKKSDEEWTLEEAQYKLLKDLKHKNRREVMSVDS